MVATFDVIVVGGGTIGLSAAYHAKSMLGSNGTVALFDQYGIYNDKNSSRGLERMFRILYSQPERVRLVETAYAMWHEMESYTGEKILAENPLIFFGYPGVETFEGSITAIRKSMAKLGIPYEYLASPDDIANFSKVFKPDKMPADYVGLVQNNGATINVMNSFRSFQQAAVDAGVTIYAEGAQKITNILPQSGGQAGYALTREDGAQFHAGHVILCPGMWLNDVLKGFHLKASSKWKIQQMTLAYFPVKDFDVHWPIWYEFGNTETFTEGLYYGFPNVRFTSPTYGKLKISCDYTYTEYTDPSQVSNYPDPNIVSNIQKHLRDLVVDGLIDIDNPVLEQACPYSTAPDGDMVIGKIPLNIQNEAEYFQNAALFCMASGRGFKFTPVFGRALASIALTGQSAYEQDLHNFRTTRPGIFQSLA